MLQGQACYEMSTGGKMESNAEWEDCGKSQNNALSRESNRYSVLVSVATMNLGPVIPEFPVFSDLYFT